MTTSQDDRARRDDDARDEAQARLDQLRTEAGMPLRGEELAQRAGVDAPLNEDPPLDWRMTPRNVALQLGAIALFAAVVWFLGSLIYDSVSALVAHYGA